MKKCYVLLIVFVGLCSEHVLAGQKVLLNAESDGQVETMSFEYLNENTQRMELVSRPEGYTLFRDNRVYLVSKMNGQLVVLDMASIGEMRQNMKTPSDFSKPMKILDMSPTGKKEQVAGINGDVYQIVWRDEKGTLHDDTIVLSGDPRAKEWTDMWQKAMTKMQTALSNEPADTEFADRMQKEGKGLLRLGTTWVVKSIEYSDNPNQFELPAQPTSMPNFSNSIRESMDKSISGGDVPKNMMQPNSSGSPATGLEPQQAGQERGNDSIYSSVEEKVDDKVERQKRRQEQKMDSRVDREVDKTVDKAMDKTLDTLFDGIQGLFD